MLTLFRSDREVTDPKQARWVMTVAQFDVEFVHVNATDSRVSLADWLSRRPSVMDVRVASYLAGRIVDRATPRAPSEVLVTAVATSHGLDDLWQKASRKKMRKAVRESLQERFELANSRLRTLACEHGMPVVWTRH